jgi:cytochrome c
MTSTALPDAEPPRILLFSKTTGFRHESIPDAIAALEKLGAQHGFAVDATEDAATFTDERLGHYRAVVFLMTTGDVLDDAQQAAFERYIRAGNGYVGVHSASDTEYSWPWYGELVGAYFSDHPAIQQARIQIEDSTHPSTAGLPNPWTRTDEWYNFRTNPRVHVHVLATLDEATYQCGTMGADHPIAWYHDYDGGRAWYTAGGHTSASYTEPEFLQHLLGGIFYAAQL